jgi:His-Xaa-Ser system radical SAM maturase HxsB
VIKIERAATALAPYGWQLLPLRFHRINADLIVLTNLVGEHAFVTPNEFSSVVEGTCADQELLARLRATHLIQAPGDTLPTELLAIKLRTRMHRLQDSTALHIFVVTLRCEHTCRYCQVSRQSAAKNDFDMTEETARRALEFAFKSPSPQLKIEFQGGEPLLNFPLIRWITDEARRMNKDFGKDLAFVIATNLALIDDEILGFCSTEHIQISTSLDGPQDLHNGNRRRPGNDSWQQSVAGIRRVQQALGPDRVSALMTTTEASLDRAHEIIDTYAELGLRGVFLRPISPYGFALRRRAGANYGVDRWLEFYRAGLDRIVELNKQGVPMMEIYASIVAKKMLTNADPGYVDLTSPAGIGIGAIVYNYNGDVYASDEGRMLAEMGDHTFRLGSIHESSYSDIMFSDALLDPLTESITVSAPMCSTCAFEPYCGADPVFHHTTMGNFVGHKAMSAFCRRNMGVFTFLMQKMHDDSYFRDLLWRWAQ